ncbi:hypothetical protein BBM86_05195 [Vibrio parahaemolyticus]|uniref:hypothetical protein n=1 Tax=Vibrio harveyi group TaxID=717610 RepID=UPI00028DDA98|nr:MULTISPECIES: hypothetical protein [Vibrio harveyi group]EGR2779583.1 hypothetical protein [Vibrio parahaemolyticus]EHW0655870.1 hypothetical protein [Vibrio parahaemolyticus]EJC6730975.1 hypothetical protein [Vibrio parahaemolyticus]EJC6944173.1 hypothetical protein [Vibrio parahaemolyticus]EJC7029273.1 hypothetical protein [Vibrio parahaemolyticus]
MKNKLELLGYRFEIAGLVFAVLAVVWQANFSGWWDTERVEWQYSIQEEANLAVLRTLKDIVLLQAIDDQEELKKRASHISQEANDAVWEIITERLQRDKRLKEQANLFSIIAFILVALSAVFIVVGKVLVYKSVKLSHGKESLKP